MKTICFVGLLFVLASCSRPCSEEKIIGVKIYEYDGDYDELFSKWNQLGINSVFASVQLLSDQGFKDCAKKNNKDTFVILPIFYSEEELEKDSSLFAITQFGTRAEKEWVKFICPSAEEYKNKKIKFIADFVKQHHPAGISLDFIRHFAYWEKIYPDQQYDSLPNTCFDDRCLQQFSASSNLELPSWIKFRYEVYEWIKENCFEQWVTWKCGIITDFVKKTVETVKMIDPDIKINLHAVPWRESDFDGAIKKIIGQDFKVLSHYVDYFSPMTYSHMTKREPKWISSVTAELHEETGVNILPSIQVSTAYLSDTLSLAEFEQSIEEAIRQPSSGIVFWNWRSLESEKEKYDLVSSKFGISK